MAKHQTRARVEKDRVSIQPSNPGSRAHLGDQPGAASCFQARLQQFQGSTHLRLNGGAAVAGGVRDTTAMPAYAGFKRRSWSPVEVGEVANT